MGIANRSELDLLAAAVDTLSGGFDSLPDYAPPIDRDAVHKVLQEVARRMHDNYPFYHPRYAGQMLKPPHPVARLAYALSLWVNPNNHALDGGWASSELEKECVDAIARMFGLATPLGHLCGGGTMANLEALWVAGRLQEGRKVVASAQAHYTHGRISEVLRLPFLPVAATPEGRMDVDALEGLLNDEDVGTVVVTLGTTGLGAVDPLADVLELQQQFGFRIHVDAAYGGYFTLTRDLGSEARRHFDRIAEADSVVIDPHKHGLQPYGCGCVLFSDPSIGKLYQHDSPYTYFSSAELHLGEISLECSRPGAAAVALWATQRLLPMSRDGDFARSLGQCLAAAQALWERVDRSERFAALMRPELDLVVFAVDEPDAEAASRRAREVFEKAAKARLHLAVVELPVGLVRHYLPGLEPNRETVTCLRSVLMKPEHLEWMDDIWAVLERAGA